MLTSGCFGMAVSLSPPPRTAPARRPGERTERSRIEKAAMRRRKLVTRIHRWLTLIFGTWALLQGITGLVMVTADQQAMVTHPGIYDHGDGDVGVGAAVAGARAAVPDAVFPSTIGLPAANHGVYRVSMVVDPTTFEQRLVYVDPATGAANAVRNADEGLVNWAARWHRYLLQDPDSTVLGIAADQIVGWMAVGTVVTLLTGLWLWYWPKVRRWKLGVRVRRGAYSGGLDLHRTVGILVVPVLFVLLATGLNIAFGQNLRGVWYAATPGADTGPRADAYGSTVPPPSSRVPASSDGSTPAALSLDDQVVNALAVIPDSEAVAVKGGGKPDGAVQVKLSHGWDPARGPEGRGGNVTVYLDQYSGDVLRVDRPEQKSASGQAYEYWAFPVHLGTFGGLPTRVLWLAACIGPLVLGASGLMTLEIRRGKRRRRRRSVHRALPALTRQQVRDVAQHAVPRETAPGDVLAEVGAPSTSFFVVVKGHLEVTGAGDDGPDTFLRSLGPGDHFGEIGLLRGTPRTARVVATSAGEVISVTRNGFDRLVEASATTLAGLEDIAAERLATGGSPDGH